MSWKPTVIATFNEPLEAQLACSRLEAEGIRAAVADANVIGIDPMYSAALGGVKVVVDEADAQNARALLAEDHSADAEQAAEQSLVSCPRCASPENTPVRSALLAIASFLLLGYPLAARKKQVECQTCGHRWQPGS